MCEYTTTIQGSQMSMGNSSIGYNHSRIFIVYSRVSAFSATSIHGSPPFVRK